MPIFVAKGYKFRGFFNHPICKDILVLNRIFPGYVSRDLIDLEFRLGPGLSTAPADLI